MKHRMKLLALVTLGMTATFATSPKAIASTFDTLNVVQESNLSAYKKVYIAPVGVELKERFRRNLRDIGAPRPTDERDQQKRAEDARITFTRAFEKKYEVVDAPAEDVLTVEAVITRLESTRPTFADYDVTPGLSPSSIYVGGADYHVRLKNGDTLLAELSEKYQTDLNDGLPRNGIWTDFEYASSRMASKLIKHIKKN